MRQLILILLLWVLAPGHAGATADGPDFWRVTGVAANDVLNIRAAPDARATKVGEIPSDGRGLTNLGCVGGLSHAEFIEATEAEKEAGRRARWCMVMIGKQIGWVAGRFLLEGEDPQHPVAYRMVDHAGSEWGATLLGGETPGDRAWLQFAPGHRIHGNTGCNGFSGTFVQRGQEILIGDLAVTRKACPDAAMRTERAMLSVLSRARTIVGGRFTMALFDAEGRRLAIFGRTDWD